MDAVISSKGGVAPGEIVASQYPELFNRTIERINNYLEQNLKVKLDDGSVNQMPSQGHYVIYPYPYLLDNQPVAKHVMVGWNLKYGSIFYDPQIGRRVGAPGTYRAFKVEY